MEKLGLMLLVALLPLSSLAIGALDLPNWVIMAKFAALIAVVVGGLVWLGSTRRQAS